MAEESAIEQMELVINAPVVENKPIYAIDSIRQKVESESSEKLETFLKSDELRKDVVSALIEHSRLEILLKWSPNKRDEILAVVPDESDWKRGNNPITDKERKREELCRYAPYKMGGEKGLNFEARHFASLQAQDAIIRAKQEAESSTEEGSVLVVQTNNEDIIKIIESGEYKASLDDPEKGYDSFPQYIKEEMDAYVSGSERLAGIDPFIRRYIRERQLGLYPEDGEKKGIPHPVYGQMVIDETIVLKKASAGESYGNVHLRLRTENIKGRTLFYMDDSLNNEKNGFQLAWKEAAKARVFLDSLENSSHLDWRVIPVYIEAQVLGGVSIKDIDGCDFISNESTKNLEEYFSKNPDQFEVVRDKKGLVRVKFK